MQPSHTCPRLEIRHLRLVRAIAAEGTVTRAAGQLHLSQSAVSHQLVDLERDLQTRLFDRVGKRMIPTAAGNRVLALAERLLSELATLERDLATDERRARLPLRLTTSCYTAYEWLPPALVHFTKAHPRVDITIVLEATRRGMEALTADEVDLAIVPQPPRDPTWATMPIVTSQFVAVASPKHLAMTRGALESGVVKWRDLRNTTVLVHDISEELNAMLENAVRDSWHAKSGERLVRPIELRKIPLTEALIELARSNHGVMIADAFIVDPYFRRKRGEGARGLVCAPFSPSAERSFHLVWRKKNPRALPLSDLAEIIRDAGKRALTPTIRPAKKPTKGRGARSPETTRRA
jgi:LysR family transcriptional regulator, regulator for metE and metH